MLYNIKTGHNGVTRRDMSEIVILTTSLNLLQKNQIEFLFTDRHAYQETAQFYSDLCDLDRLRWDLWQQRDFQRDPEEPGKVDSYQAEALVYNYLPAGLLKGVLCSTLSVRDEVKRMVDSARVKLPVEQRKNWFF